MYVKRVRLTNYGPIERVDLQFPFDNDKPQPVVLVGANGSGKSIVLSHIANGLLSAKGTAYSETPEVTIGKVYKLRSNEYIRNGKDFYFAETSFEGGLSLAEMRIRNSKVDGNKPEWITSAEIEKLWQQINVGDNDCIEDTMPRNEKVAKELFSKNCVLYFPSNRFEEPAWLNEQNLLARAEYMNPTRLTNYTDRQVITYSPLHDNQNWLFGVVYDRAAFEMRTFNVPQSVEGRDQPVYLPLFGGYAGDATSIYETALTIVRRVLNQQVRFGIGGRLNRTVSIVATEADYDLRIPNVFQLSSGETSLLNLFLSILRDFDFTRAHFDKTDDIRGIVVVDEVDLHLHSFYQSSVLPGMIRMFPNVQFVLTTHSPLFVLGMNEAFGQDGFALYHLPSGEQISAEEFSEFHNAYQTLKTTSSFMNDIQAAVEQAQKPLVFPEGVTDVNYVRRAGELLGRTELLERVEIRDGGGAGNLTNTWREGSLLAKAMPQHIMLLFDCDTSKTANDKGNLHMRCIPFLVNNFVKEGIENLFSKPTLQRVRTANPTFLDIEEEHNKVVGNATEHIPERWTVAHGQKVKLCDWLCEHGTAEDFKAFEVIFEMIEAVLGPSQTPENPG